MWAVAQIPEQEAAEVHVGTPARIVVPAAGGGPVEATLMRFGVSADRAKSVKAGQLLGLESTAGKIVGVIEVADVYERDLGSECKHVFRTDDKAHPGVAEVMARGPWCVGGKVSVFPAEQVSSMVRSAGVPIARTISAASAIVLTNAVWPRSSGSMQ